MSVWISYGIKLFLATDTGGLWGKKNGKRMIASMHI